MEIHELLSDILDRVRIQVPDVVGGLDEETLARRPGDVANPIAWLVWHLTRIEDDHIAGVAGTPQAWHADGWADRFGLALDPADHGFGHTAAQVAQVRASADLLAGYHEAVAQRAMAYVTGLAPADLERVVDEDWDPPVSLGVRLVSVVCEVNQHLGQAAYVRGLLDPR